MANMQIKQILGFTSGEFKKDSFSDAIQFSNIWCKWPVKDGVGFQAEKYKLAGADVFDGISIGDYVELYFTGNNENAKVALINKIEPDEATRLQFGEILDVNEAVAMLDEQLEDTIK